MVCVCVYVCVRVCEESTGVCQDLSRLGRPGSVVSCSPESNAGEPATPARSAAVAEGPSASGKRQYWLWTLSHPIPPPPRFGEESPGQYNRRCCLRHFQCVYRCARKDREGPLPGQMGIAACQLIGHVRDARTLMLCQNDPPPSAPPQPPLSKQVHCCAASCTNAGGYLLYISHFALYNPDVILFQFRLQESDEGFQNCGNNALCCSHKGGGASLKRGGSSMF